MGREESATADPAARGLCYLGWAFGLLSTFFFEQRGSVFLPSELLATLDSGSQTCCQVFPSGKE